MAISELVKYEGDNSTFIWKYPNEDFNNMTELVVHESQEAIFFANGQAADTFGPGRYKLDAENIPILTKLINIVTGVSVFHSEVFFINKTVQMAIKWGTDSKVRFNEPRLGLPIELGASGEMNLAVKDGRKLLLKLVGTMNGIAWDKEGAGFTQSLKTSFRPLITTAVKSNLSAVIKQQNIDIIEIDEYLGELSEALRRKIVPGFEEYGLTIPEFYITNIVLPESDPNFRKLRELHTVTLQEKMMRTDARLKSVEAESRASYIKAQAQADADIKATQAQSRAAYMKAEAQAESEIKTAEAESRAAYQTAEANAQEKINIAQRGAVLEEQLTETEIARREAERQIIAAQANAQAQQLQAQADAHTVQAVGLAEAAVMDAKGYSQKDIIQADVQKSYADSIGNMGPAITAGGGGASVMGDMLGLGVGLSAMEAIAPRVGEVMKGFKIDGNNGQSDAVNNTPSVEVVKCVNCGNELPANAKFCLECGTKVVVIADDEVICRHCGGKTKKGKFCMECGQPLSNHCPNCGMEVPEGGKFCLECGTKL